MVNGLVRLDDPDGRIAPAAFWILFACAFAARAVAILAFADFDPRTAQLWEYGQQASCAVVTGGPLCLYAFPAGQATPYPSAFMPPLLSYLWWGLFEVFGISKTAVGAFLAINAAIGAACAPLLMRLSRQIGFPPIAALAAGAILALYPSFVYVAATTHNTNWAVLFFLGLAVLAIDLMRRPNLAQAAAFGVAAGLAALNRSEMLIIAPALALAFGIAGRRLSTPVVALACMALVIMPWALRNERLFGAPIPTAQSAGYNLWKAFAPGADGSGEAAETDPGFIAARAATRASVPVGPRYEAEVDALYLAKARAEIAAMGPLDHVRIAALKIARLWLFDWSDPLARSAAYLAPWTLANLLALAGLGALWRRRREIDPWALVVIVLVVGGLTAAHMTTFVHARYRMHLEPFLFILAGAALAELQRLANAGLGGGRSKSA